MRVMRRNRNDLAALALLATIATANCSRSSDDPANPTGAPAAEPATPAITATRLGEIDRIPVQLYTLTNTHGLVARITNYGAILTELHVPDRAGALADIVLGFDSLEGYVKNSPFFGATVGRVANRIRNATFTLGREKYGLPANDNPHHLHGGDKGWDKVVWTAETLESPEGPQIRLSYVSKDGEQGYPGTVTAHATYTLTHQNELRVEMEATTDTTTLVNMAHHSYWNLGGHGSGAVTGHELTLFADQYTPGDPMVPTGVVTPVRGTPFDFTQSKAIGKDLAAAGGQPVGFDHNFVVNGDPSDMRPVARLRDPKSGRVLLVQANQPGVQFYSGNFLNGSITGKGGARYAQYAGLCLETQKFPNAINVPAWRDQVILEPGQTYRHAMVHRFTTE
jgi:aldose 1-epimerase